MISYTRLKFTAKIIPEILINNHQLPQIMEDKEAVVQIEHGDEENQEPISTTTGKPTALMRLRRISHLTLMLLPKQVLLFLVIRSRGMMRLLLRVQHVANSARERGGDARRG